MLRKEHLNDLYQVVSVTIVKKSFNINIHLNISHVSDTQFPFFNALTDYQFLHAISLRFEFTIPPVMTTIHQTSFDPLKHAPSLFRYQACTFIHKHVRCYTFMFIYGFRFRITPKC